MLNLSIAADEQSMLLQGLNRALKEENLQKLSSEN